MQHTPDMPQSVIDNSIVDYILSVTAIAEAIQETIAGKKLNGAEIPLALIAETALMEKTIISP